MDSQKWAFHICLKNFTLLHILYYRIDQNLIWSESYSYYQTLRKAIVSIFYVHSSMNESISQK